VSTFGHMRRTGRTKRLTATGLTTICILAVVTPSSSAQEVVTGPPRVEPVHWYLNPQPPVEDGPKTVSIVILTGYCVGEPIPRFDHVEIVERRSRERPVKSSVITAFVRHEEPREVVGPIIPGEPVHVCAGLGHSIQKRIKLKRPAEDLVFFDGSYELPRRVPHPR
jgi:hypothetical protein